MKIYLLSTDKVKNCVCLIGSVKSIYKKCGIKIVCGGCYYLATNNCPMGPVL